MAASRACRPDPRAAAFVATLDNVPDTSHGPQRDGELEHPEVPWLNALICRRPGDRHVDELPLCEARSMTDKPRYQLRANSAALTRFQWWIVGMAFFVAAVGAVLALAGRTPFGTMLMGLSVLTGTLTVVSANGRDPSK
jgi:hypothetical protein